MGRVIFGSDYPFYMQDEMLESLYSAADMLYAKYDNFITNEDIDKILLKNALNLFERIKDNI